MHKVLMIQIKMENLFFYTNCINDSLCAYFTLLSLIFLTWIIIKNKKSQINKWLIDEEFKDQWKGYKRCWIKTRKKRLCQRCLFHHCYFQIYVRFISIFTCEILHNFCRILTLWTFLYPWLAITRNRKI